MVQEMSATAIAFYMDDDVASGICQVREINTNIDHVD